MWERLIRRNVPFLELEALQDAVVELVRKDREKAYLILAEPLPTFTSGRSALPEDLLWSVDQCREAHVDLARVSRGGKWTYHGPGQIIVYPILSLQNFGYGSKEIGRFIDDMTSCVQSVIDSFGISVERKDRPTGLYAKGSKISSFGVAVRGGICSHGAAIYLTDQSQFFPGILACGRDSREIISFEQLGALYDWDEVGNRLFDAFKNCFKNRKKSITVFSSQNEGDRPL